MSDRRLCSRDNEVSRSVLVVFNVSDRRLCSRDNQVEANMLVPRNVSDRRLCSRDNRQRPRHGVQNNVSDRRLCSRDNMPRARTCAKRNVSDRRLCSRNNSDFKDLWFLRKGYRNSICSYLVGNSLPPPPNILMVSPYCLSVTFKIDTRPSFGTKRFIRLT